MDEVSRFFEKASIIFDLLKDGNEVTLDTLKEKLGVSEVTVKKSLMEFNTFEDIVVFPGKGRVMFSEKKDSLLDCKTYGIYYMLIKKMCKDPEHYFSGNEIAISNELGIDRTILQKLKTLVRLKAKAFFDKDGD